jgi:homoserine dehydrogenase
MSVQCIDPPASAWPIKVRTAKPRQAPALRTIRIGILGLGQVGQAVARLAADRSAAAHAGIRFHVEQALVRDVSKPRRCSTARLTSSPAAFLRGHYDVVVEALDAVEPARTIVATLLGRGTAVVSANKALVAEHREQLDEVAGAHGAAFRYEATALSAVPFIGTLAARPLVASVNRLLAIVNGTSNFILSTLADGAPFAEALTRAQQLGYAEPDPSRDLDGLDAADKLTLLTSLFGWGRLSRESLEVTGIRRITPHDLAAARSIGGTIKAVVSAERDEQGLRGFVGPVFLPSSEPLASLSGALNGIKLDGRHVPNLFFSGPGAGPDVTAATLLDDAIEATARPTPVQPARGAHRHHASQPPVLVASQNTSWLLRVTCPGVLPPAASIAALVSGAGLRVERAADHATSDSRWLFIAPHGRGDVDAALVRLATTHRIDAAAFRRL